MLIENGRILPGTSKTDRRLKLFATKGTDQQMTGSCIYFSRINIGFDITDNNVNEVCI